MKRILFIILIIQFYSCVVFAQGEYGNYWVFSQFLGLNFNAGNLPVADTSNIYGPWYPTSSICDKDGNLVCYVGTWKWADFDVRLYNKFHTLVQGGDQLFVQSGGQYSQYAGYSDLLFFEDNVDSLVLVKLSANHILNNQNFNYSLIDAKANFDTGIVYSTNNKILDFTAVIGPIGLIRHANGRDWWILIHGYPNDKYYKFLASPYRVEFIGEQSIGTKCGILNPTFSNYESMGEFSVNLEGNKVAFCNLGGLIEAYDFDRCTGSLSNAVTLQTVYSGNNSLLNTKSANISPSGRFVYGVSYYSQPPGPGPNPVSYNLGQIVQYDLQAADPANDTVVVYSFGSTQFYVGKIS